MDDQVWLASRQYSSEKMALARKILEEVRKGRDVSEAVRRNPMPDGGYLGKHVLVAAYRQLVARRDWLPDNDFLSRIRMKPVRTLSGVTTVTVLTKPYPCRGECIFCPTYVQTPKSYVPDEPGAKRAIQHAFDPYAQVCSRLEALQAIGHPADKVELLILGGTWSYYPRDYQKWFIQRCFEAMNGFEASSLEDAFSSNETARYRNVGLVVETRPDEITPDEVVWMRKLGITKVQLGAQSLDDRILELNHRNHKVEQTRQAVALLRAAGFKIVLHWMPNLFGSSLEMDRVDFHRLWDGFCPDEIKIYPNQLLRESKLYACWLRGDYKPYTTQELVGLIADIKETIPKYCRLNRVIRDIPSNYVIEGNKRTSLRQDIHKEMSRRGTRCECIRCREIRNQVVNLERLIQNDIEYKVGDTLEHFISYVTQEDKLAGFLRLSLPGSQSPQTGIKELDNVAIIREVHIYGQSLRVGEGHGGAAQHVGLGTRLIQEAEHIARTRGFRKLAVISAVGTRVYYLKRGFERGDLYLVKNLT